MGRPGASRRPEPGKMNGGVRSIKSVAASIAEKQSRDRMARPVSAVASARMDLHRLRCFAVVAEELHFTRAADRLHVGQPALSRQIRKLEDELGTALFVRTSRRVELTEAGRELLREASTLLAEATALQERFRPAATGH
jgi:hypothetical protein